MRRLTPFGPQRVRPTAFTSRDGTVHLIEDPATYGFHVDAWPGYTALSLAEVLAQARRRGLEPLDPDEFDSVTVDGGINRIWLTLIDPPPIVIVEPSL